MNLLRWNDNEDVLADLKVLLGLVLDSFVAAEPCFVGLASASSPSASAEDFAVVLPFERDSAFDSWNSSFVPEICQVLLFCRYYRWLVHHCLVHRIKVRLALIVVHHLADSDTMRSHLIHHPSHLQFSISLMRQGSKEIAVICTCCGWPWCWGCPIWPIGAIMPGWPICCPMPLIIWFPIIRPWLWGFPIPCPIPFIPIPPDILNDDHIINICMVELNSYW